MRENFLHYIWLYKKFKTLYLRTTQQEAIQILSSGSPNSCSGPDFFNAQMYIGDQLWAGNVEIHIRSSDWYIHNHQLDRNYDNVILHVVWEHDTEIYRNDNSPIPTLELATVVEKNAADHYYKLFSKEQRWINCEYDFAQVDTLIMYNWLERLYIERLERKTQDIKGLLETSKNNWEAVFFKMLAKNFGLKVNGEAFLSIANSFDFSIVLKLRSKPMHLEALFFGQADLLVSEIQDDHVIRLQNEYAFLKQKFNLRNHNIQPLQFFRLRPSNFPTIRLSQLAQVYYHREHLFSKAIKATTQKELYHLFNVSASSYWNNHFTFGKVSRPSKKNISRSFIDLLIINTIVPLKFAYAKYIGEDNTDHVIALIQEVRSEKNSITEAFNKLRPISESAMESPGTYSAQK